MYQHILVAVDGSPTSDLALFEAIRLAQMPQAQLRLLHVVDELSFNWDGEFTDPTEIWKLQKKAGQAVLRKAKAAASKAGITADTRLVEISQLGYRVPEVIAQEADAWPADVIVLGTHGRRGLSRIFLGSIAEGVVRVARQPVLLIRGQQEMES